MTLIKDNRDPSVIVAQIGARMHYAVPEIMARNGLLHSFHTDIVAPAARTSRLLGGSPLARRYRGRIISDRLRAKTVQHRFVGLYYALKLRQAKTAEARTAVFTAQARRFGCGVVRSPITGANAVYAFTTAAQEILEHTRARGLHGLLEQYIASQPMRDDLLLEEHRRFADWEADGAPVLSDPAYRARLEREWDLADTILCPSDYVAQSLRDENVAPGKLTVVPYGVPLPDIASPDPQAGQRRKLRILFVGSVELRKGIHYLAEALAMLPKGSVEARIVGSVRLAQSGLRQLGELANVVGRVPRADMADQFDWADVFVLPSLVEGSATVTYEAIARGVPVICTPNTGSVVRNGETGCIVAPFSGRAIADALTAFLDSPDRLAEMKHQVWQNRADVSVERYEADLLNMVRDRLALHPA